MYKFKLKLIGISEEAIKRLLYQSIRLKLEEFIGMPYDALMKSRIDFEINQVLSRYFDEFPIFNVRLNANGALCFWSELDRI